MQLWVEPLERVCDVDIHLWVDGVFAQLLCAGGAQKAPAALVSLPARDCSTVYFYSDRAASSDRSFALPAPSEDSFPAHRSGVMQRLSKTVLVINALFGYSVTR